MGAAVPGSGERAAPSAGLVGIEREVAPFRRVERLGFFGYACEAGFTEDLCWTGGGRDLSSGTNLILKISRC